MTQDRARGSLSTFHPFGSANVNPHAGSLTTSLDKAAGPLGPGGGAEDARGCSTGCLEMPAGLAVRHRSFFLRERQLPGLAVIRLVVGAGFY